ncbi:hypothetical protein [Metabacillus fastidiosus]|uniref:hypothetical protein n=1 Tax=Metabacillus fastidiosus TaxID=1458 RepID=UPI002DBDEB9F|nr:hypothetical protein [Metabacillus fastidiosus]MEC2075128.1 hypothetical protein [Metabacillus fastidiosus]
MNAKHLGICFIILLLVILSWCTVNNFSSNEVPTANYVFGFPKEPSPALTEFMNVYLNKNDYLLIRDNNVFVYAKDNGSAEAKQLSYYSFSKSSLEKIYEPLLGKRDPIKKWDEIVRMKEKQLEQKELIDTKKFNLPSVILKEDNQLEITTKYKSKIISLPELLAEYGVRKSDRLIVNISEINDQFFILDIQDPSIEDAEEGILYTTLFIKQDLSDFKVSELTNEDLQAALDKGELDQYKAGLKKVNDSKRYAFLFDDMIVDLEKNQIIEINENDYISNDGKYVYINGQTEELPDRAQKIQTIDNYMAGNEVYEIEYSLDYKEIAKELDFVTSGIGSADVNYFNENYIVLRLRYNGKFVGTAGLTNVIIDFQENKEKPTFYLVDLDLSNIEQIR